MIKAAIVGVTGFGAAHYHDLLRENKAGRVLPVAAVVRTPSKAQEQISELTKLGCDILPDFETLLAKYAGKLDICCIPTGIAQHKPMTVAACEAGWNVFVEKPVAGTKAEADAMAEASERTGKYVAVGYQTMYQPELHHIKEILLSGIIGKPLKFKCYALWPRPHSYYGRNPWAGKLFGADGDIILDSPFTNALAHDLNLQLFFAGKTFRDTADIVSIQGSLFRANKIESCDTVSLKLITAQDQEIIFTVSHACNFNVNPENVIECEKGVIYFGRNDNKVKVVGKDGNVIETFDYYTPDNVRTNIWNALINRLTDPEQFICDAVIASKHTLVANAVFDNIEIRDVPEEFVRRAISFDETDGRRTVIAGIEKAIRDSYDAGRLLDETDFPFAAPGKAFTLDGYKSFEGRLYGKN